MAQMDRRLSKLNDIPAKPYLIIKIRNTRIAQNIKREGISVKCQLPACRQ